MRYMCVAYSFPVGLESGEELPYIEHLPRKVFPPAWEAHVAGEATKLGRGEADRDLNGKLVLFLSHLDK